jgi:hypothetical protein
VSAVLEIYMNANEKAILMMNLGGKVAQIHHQAKPV